MDSVRPNKSFALILPFLIEQFDTLPEPEQLAALSCQGCKNVRQLPTVKNKLVHGTVRTLQCSISFNGLA